MDDDKRNRRKWGEGRWREGEGEREGESESEKNQQILWWWRIITVREKETEQRNTRVNFTKVNTKKRYSHAGDSLRFAEEQKKLIF